MTQHKSLIISLGPVRRRPLVVILCRQSSLFWGGWLTILHVCMYEHGKDGRAWFKARARPILDPAPSIPWLLVCVLHRGGQNTATSEQPARRIGMNRRKTRVRTRCRENKRRLGNPHRGGGGWLAELAGGAWLCLRVLSKKSGLTRVHPCLHTSRIWPDGSHVSASWFRAKSRQKAYPKQISGTRRIQAVLDPIITFIRACFARFMYGPFLHLKRRYCASIFAGYEMELDKP